MEEIQSFLDHQPLLREFAAGFCAGRPCYLVGGAVRDALLGRAAYDFDFATPDDPTDLARAWARARGGHWFWLDEGRRQSRVAIPHKDNPLIFDFAPFRGDDLAADLLGRDFTVNAMALEISSLFQGAPALIDPLKGGRDLQAGRLRACAPQTFADDPLRVLRAGRFAATLEFHLEDASAELASNSAPRLDQVAGERIKAELFALFSAEAMAQGLAVLGQVGALPILFGPAVTEQAAAAGIAAASRLQDKLKSVPKPFCGLLDVDVEAGLSRAGLLRLAAFLRSLAETGCDLDPGKICSRMAFSRAVAQRLGALLTLESVPCRDLPPAAATERGLALWAAGLGRDAPDALFFIYGLRDLANEEVDLLWRSFAAWLNVAQDGRIAPLVDGRWIARELGIRKGRAIGQLLQELACAEIAGRVQGPEDAEKFLKKRAQKEIDKG